MRAPYLFPRECERCVCVCVCVCVVRCACTPSLSPQDARVGMVTFGSAARLEFHLNEHNTTDAVVNAISDAKWHDSNTNTSGGIW